MNRALRGINLGGWLTAERWMTPSLFEGVSGDGEIALVRELGYDLAKQRLIKHRDSFITGNDFAWIKKHGFDFVRLPVGYWLFEKTDDFIDGEHHIRQAFEWANKYKLGVVLDFHGLQGSQNGHGHSGQTGKVRLYRNGNKQRALRTLEYMCQTYGDEKALIGIEIINEPKVRWFLWRLLRFYDKAYRLVEKNTREDVRVIVSDAFYPVRIAKRIAKRSYGSRLVLDVHLYQVHSKRDINLSYREHLAKVDNDWRDLLAELNKYMDVMVGEWSMALPTRVISSDEQYTDYFQKQRSLFDKACWAHCYWTYKAPNNGPWDYRSRHSNQE